jgi:hypothetical protein
MPGGNSCSSDIATGYVQIINKTMLCKLQLGLRPINKLVSRVVV